MNAPACQLTVDDAMWKFQIMLREALGGNPPDAATRPETPEEREERLFRFAEAVLGLACPDPRACSDPHCRRNVCCRHFARIGAKRVSGTASHPRRTPGAEAARYAVWVYMSADP